MKRPFTQVCLAVLVLAVVAMAILPVAPPMLFVAVEPGAVDPGDVIVVIRNPLRNRGPEKPAVRLLRDLQSGNCAPIRALMPADAAHVCERERELRLLRWSLIGRKDSGAVSKMHYRVWRQGYGDAWGNVWISVRREESGYRVTDFSTAY